MAAILACSGVWVLYQFGKYRLLCWRQQRLNEYVEGAIRGRIESDAAAVAKESGGSEGRHRRARGSCAICRRPLWLRVPCADAAPRGGAAVAAGWHSDTLTARGTVVHLTTCRCCCHHACFLRRCREVWGVASMPWQASFYTEENLDPANLCRVVKKLFRGQNEDAQAAHFNCPRCLKDSAVITALPAGPPDVAAKSSLAARLREQIPDSVAEDDLRTMLLAQGDPRWVDICAAEDWLSHVEKHDPAALAELLPPTVERHRPGEGQKSDAEGISPSALCVPRDFF